MTTIRLPLADRSFENYTVKNRPLEVKRGAAQSGNASRIAYSAAHVTADPHADNDPWVDAAVDWDKTIAFRHYIWDLGLASPKRWIPHSAAWASIGRPRWN